MAGEASGALTDILTRLVKHLTNMKILRDRVQQALIYPAFLVLAGIGLIIIFITVMVPQLKGILHQHERRHAAAAHADADRGERSGRAILVGRRRGGPAGMALFKLFTRSPAGRLDLGPSAVGRPRIRRGAQLPVLRAVRPHDGHVAAKRRHPAAHDGTARRHVGQHVSQGPHGGNPRRARRWLQSFGRADTQAFSPNCTWT